MTDPDNELLQERSVWLAELACAVNDAQRLTWALGASGENRLAMELYAKLEVVRLEIEDLRSRARATRRNNLDPFWVESPLWAAGRRILD